MDRQALPSLPCPRPRSLLGWLPALWSHALFPGIAPEPGRWRWLPLVWVFLLPAVLLYPCLAFPLLEPDETRYAEIPCEMLVRGEVVVPLLQGEPYLDKPPLLYWLVMGSYRIFGVHDWAARLVPALAVHASILLVYLFGRRFLGGRAAFRAALLLALAPGFLGMGRFLLIDGVLTFCVTLALFCAFEAVRGSQWHKGWWLASALACGLGVLAKGPVAVLLVLPPVWLYGWLTGRAAQLSWRRLAAFLLMTGAVALPWYVALGVRLPGFVRYFFWEHNLVRFLAPEHHVQGAFYYLPVVLLAMLPGTLLAVPLVRFLLSARPEESARRSPEMGFQLLAAGWCVLFFTLSSCKLPTYVLPAFPPLALALGAFVAQDRWRASPWPARAAGTSFLLLAVAHYVVIPWYADHRSPMRDAERVRRLCGDPAQVVVCYPRPCNSLSFYLGRSDLREYRSKDIEELRAEVRKRPRTVILCTHRHSLAGLRQLLPPEVPVVHSAHVGLPDLPGVPAAWQEPLRKLMGETALGLCDIAVVEYRPYPPYLPAPPGRGEAAEPPVPTVREHPRGVGTPRGRPERTILPSPGGATLNHPTTAR